ncbi:MAG: AAA family ATPase, partial [Leptospiraceae bacterium]|nr:AAA family ATPase [Leptospiraceae bacterium]
MLKELEIFGFKSFAEKTRFTFSSAISGIVGPNGCGKSNVLDSIKWVLGEKSVRTMRGEKMEDVIFAGTATRRPANFAQVSLTLDNRFRLLRIDSDEVKITRRLYRDGQSQYFINDSRVTLREIEDLLRDTGIGKSSYSFMEQGRMDLILSSRPEDRRLIFEEAAGISRFKAQREEAEKNLEQAQLNLTRIQDIQRELERELRLKEAQAKKTAEYNALVEKYREHDLRIRYLQLRDAEEKLTELRTKLARRHAEKEKIQQRNIRMQEQLAQLDENERQLKEELHRKDLTSQLAGEKIGQFNAAIAEKEERKSVLESQLATLREQLARVERRIRELKKEAAEKNQLRLGLDSQVSETQKEITNLEKRIAAAEEGIRKAAQQIHKHESEKSALEQALTGLRQEHSEAIRELLQSLKNEKVRWEKTAKERENAFTEIELYCNEVNANLNALLHYPDHELPQLRQELKRLLESAVHTRIVEKARFLAELSRGLYEILFEKGGVHARKEELDEKISRCEEAIRVADHAIAAALRQKQELTAEIANIREQREKLFGELKSLNVQIHSTREKEQDIAGQLANEENNLTFLRRQYMETERLLLQLGQEQKNLAKEVEKLRTSMEKENQRIAGIERDIRRLEEKRREIANTLKAESSRTDEVFTAINELEGKIGTITGMRETLLQAIYND